MTLRFEGDVQRFKSFQEEEYDIFVTFTWQKGRYTWFVSTYNSKNNSFQDVYNEDGNIFVETRGWNGKEV